MAAVDELPIDKDVWSASHFEVFASFLLWAYQSRLIVVWFSVGPYLVLATTGCLRQESKTQT